MKKLLLSLLGLGAVACQPQSRPATQATSQPAPAAQAAVATVAPPHDAPAVPAPDTARPHHAIGSELLRQPLSQAAATRLLTRYNLARFWKGQDANQDDLPPLDGFFGPAHQRISFAFTSLRRDSLRPNVFHVAGKTRFFKTITPFVGELRVDTVARLRPRHGGFNDRWGLLDVDSLCRVYSAAAAFTFREDSTAAGAGVFTGTAHLDFYLDGRRQLQLAQAMGTLSNIPALGTAVLYRGRWTGYHGQPTRQLLLSRDVFAVAPAALTNFGLGDRDPSFNPKYARLGWNYYWENKEWWADPAKPAISL